MKPNHIVNFILDVNVRQSVCNLLACISRLIPFSRQGTSLNELTVPLTFTLQSNLCFKSQRNHLHEISKFRCISFDNY